MLRWGITLVVFASVLSERVESCGLKLDRAAADSNAFVEVLSVAPTLLVELPYATANNFAGKAVYPADAKAMLRAPVAEALGLVQEDLAKRGLGLKVWDAYRPFHIQEVFWQLVPNADFVAQPVRQGTKLVEGSKHNRGAAVDVTLVELRTGKELPMPSAFDDFSPKAARAYAQGDPIALANRKLLEDAMHARGFVGLPTEWWHFDWHDFAAYSLSDEPFEALRH